MKKTKFIINIVEWIEGLLRVSDIEAVSLVEAITFIDTLDGEDITIKVYDENKRIHHSRHIGHKHHKHHDHGHHHGHHDGDDDNDDSYC